MRWKQPLLAWLVLAGAVVATAPVTAQTKHPNFSGSWEQDIDASKALSEKKGHPWRTAGAGLGGANGAIPAGATVLRPVIVVTQSDAELVMEKRNNGEVMERTVLKLDGSLSVNATRNASTRSRTEWKGSALVTTGTTVFDMSADQVVDASGKAIGEITREFVATRTLMPDGTMQVENRSTQNGSELISWSVLVRTKNAKRS